MDWNMRLNQALDYIEDSLDKEIDYDHAARLAYCSRNQLSSMFFAVTGVPMGEYVRRRRLTLAALELQNSDATILEIAMKYGYSSPTAFNRAFQQQHKASPQYARSRNIFITSYSRISFQITIKGELTMKCRIEKKPAFKVVGVKKSFRTDSKENLVPDFWSDLPRETYNKIKQQAGGEPEGFLGLCANFADEPRFDYYIAVSTKNSQKINSREKNSSLLEGLEEIQIPAATWAIFEQDGSLMDLVDRIWQEWFPSSGYRRAGNSIPDVEVYFDYDFPKANYSYELWYPVEEE